MKLTTLKRRYYNVARPDYERILIILLTDFLWCNQRIQLLSESLTRMDETRISGDRRVKQIEKQVGKYLQDLPVWIKLHLIMDNPRHGYYLGELTGDVKTVWQLVK